MVGLCAVFALGAVGFWHSRGSAASLEETGVRPMIAAVAAPIWRSLPQPAKTEPERSAFSADPEQKPTTKPSAFQAATFKNAAPVAAHQVTAAEVRTLTLHANVAALATGPSMAEATASASNDASLNAVDPVSGRYGL